MLPLTLESKQFLFGAAGKKGAYVTAKTKSSSTKAITKKVTTGSASTGMLMAAGLGPETPPSSISNKSKKNMASSKESTKSNKRDAIFREVNKYGMIAISAATLINHTNTTVHKMIAAVHGDDNKFKFYEEKSRNYLKPHFSLPSQWFQARTTFGTPWYY